MANNFGGLGVADTLQALRIYNGTVVAYNTDDVWTAVNSAFIAYNRQMAEQLSLFCGVTNGRLIRYGAPQTKTMEEVSEFGRVSAQKARGGSDIGFPLRRFGAGLAWTNDYFEMTTTRDFAGEITQIFTADSWRVVRQIKRALYLATNYSFTDRLIDFATLPVKRLANGDGAALPLGPNGEIFNASTHTHYLATATGTLTAADVAGLILHVAEHFAGGKIMLVINQAQEAFIRSCTNDFVAYRYEGTVQPTTVIQAPGQTVTPFQADNRAIGIFDGAEVWVKPWSISGYMCAILVSDSEEKALVVRVRGTFNADGSMGATLPSIINGGNPSQPGMGDLRLMSQYKDYPLNAQSYYREFDISVRNRVAAAILYCTGTTYVVPTINDTVGS